MFDAALSFVLDQEAGYNPDDPSYRGILQSTYDTYRRAHGFPVQDVRRITDPELRAIYDVQYWQASSAADLDANGNTALALIVFDTAVNLGVGTAKSLRAASGDDPLLYLTLRRQRYQSIAQANPVKAKNLDGWLARVNDLQAAVGTLLVTDQGSGGSTPPGPAQAGLGGPLGILLALGVVGALFFRGTLRGFLR